MQIKGRQRNPYVNTPIRLMSTLGRRASAFLLAASVLTLSMPGLLNENACAQMLDTTARPVHGQIAISREVAITPSKDKVRLNLREADVQDVLQMLAKQGKFNIILDDSVSGTLTVDISNVSINKALEYIFTLMDLSYVKDGNTVIVAKKATIDGKNMTVRNIKSIPVQYKSAINIANQLNNTIFRVPLPGGSQHAVAAADPDSNSLLVMGTDTDIKLVGDALRELDVPRNRKVYHIKHNLPADVALVLAANFFRNNVPIAIGSSGNSTTGGTTSSATTSSTTGSTAGGTTGSTTGSATGGTTGSTTGGTTGSSTTGGASGVNNNPAMGVSVTYFTSDGVTFISEPVSSTLTVLGTEEQIALIDSVIDQIDVQRGQVAVEVALVEIQNTDTKSYSPAWGTLSSNSGFLQVNPLDPANATQNIFTIRNPLNSKSFSFPTSIKGTNVSITQNNRNVRNKVLANPTMVAVDGQAVSINITDAVASIITTITVVNGVQVSQPTVTQQQAGVTVTLTPKLYNDGSVLITNLTPTVSQPAGTLAVGTNSVTLLSTRTMTIGGVRVKDGESLVIGGLLKESDNIDINKVPGLDKLPILGAMFRALNSNVKNRTELVLMVTPHILKEDNISYFNNANSGKFSNLNYGRGGIVPVSLPKYTGTSMKPATNEGTESSTPNSHPPTSSQVPKPNQTSSAEQSKTQLTDQSFQSTSNAKGPRIEVNAPIASKDAKPEGVAALMLAKPTNKPANSNPPDGHKSVTNIYRSPIPDSPPNQNLGVMEEILK